MAYDFKNVHLYEKKEFVATLLVLCVPIVLLSIVFALIDYLKKYFEKNILKLVFYSLLFLQSACRTLLSIWVHLGRTDTVLYFDLPSLLLLALVSIVIIQVDNLFPRNVSVNRRRLALFVCNIGVCLASFSYYMFGSEITDNQKTIAVTSFLESGALVLVCAVFIWSFRDNWSNHRFMNETKLAGAFASCVVCLVVRAAVSISGIYTDFSPHEKPPELSSSDSDDESIMILFPVILYYGIGETAVCYISLYIQYLTPYAVISEEFSTIPLLKNAEKGKAKPSESLTDYYKIPEPTELVITIDNNSNDNKLENNKNYENQHQNQNPHQHHTEALKFFKLFEKSLNSANVVLHEVLGKGGSGAIVYRCTLREGPFSGGTFAVKIMKDCVPADLDALMNEVRIYQSLKHNNIVKFMGADLSSPRREVRIFMEYIPNTLDDFIRRRTMHNNLHYFPSAQIAKCMLQLISGLQVLHGHNIIHRDLKTSNIFVVMGNNGDISELKIGDFDVSTFLKRATPKSRTGYHTANKGTDGFMAPEMASMTIGKIKYDSKVDIWSMGMILYSFLTLREPYENENRFEQGFDKPPTLTDEARNNAKYAKLIRIFELCATAKPEDRPSCDQIATMLQDSISGSV